MKKATIEITLVFLLFVAAPALGQFYSVIDLGTLGGNRSAAYGINDSGQVVDQSKAEDGFWRGFIWENGMIKNLEVGGRKGSYAYDINSRGQVVGFMSTRGGAAGHNRAFVWENGKAVLPKGIGEGTVARAINNAGDIVGSSWTSKGFDLSLESRIHAVLWREDQVVDLGATGDNSIANGINDKNQIVGRFDPSLDPNSDTVVFSRAVLWENGKAVVLPAISNNAAEALAINNEGQIVGYCQDESGSGHAILWQGKKMIDLGTLGGESSIASNINQIGQIVGESYYAKGVYKKHAFIYENGKMTDLNDLIDKNSGWELSAAYDINSKGQIIGNGINPAGQQRGFLLTPK